MHLKISSSKWRQFVSINPQILCHIWHHLMVVWWSVKCEKKTWSLIVEVGVCLFWNEPVPKPILICIWLNPNNKPDGISVLMKSSIFSYLFSKNIFCGRAWHIPNICYIPDWLPKYVFFLKTDFIKFRRDFAKNLLAQMAVFLVGVQAMGICRTLLIPTYSC